MSWTGRQLLELLCFPVAIAAGQILFKRAASLTRNTRERELLLERAATVMKGRSI